MLLIGSEIYSAKAPGRFTPTPRICAHRCRRPARQFRQRPHTTWPSPLTIIAWTKVRDVRPDFHNLPDKFVPNHRGNLNRRPGPAVPFIDVQIGSTNSCHLHLDQHIVNPNRRLRYIVNPQTALIAVLHQGLHRVFSRVMDRANLVFCSALNSIAGRISRDFLFTLLIVQANTESAKEGWTAMRHIRLAELTEPLVAARLATAGSRPEVFELHTYKEAYRKKMVSSRTSSPIARCAKPLGSSRTRTGHDLVARDPATKHDDRCIGQIVKSFRACSRHS